MDTKPLISQRFIFNVYGENRLIDDNQIAQTVLYLMTKSLEWLSKTAISALG